MKKKQLKKTLNFMAGNIERCAIRIRELEQKCEHCEHCENYKPKTVKFTRFTPLPPISTIQMKEEPSLLDRYLQRRNANECKTGCESSSKEDRGTGEFQCPEQG